MEYTKSVGNITELRCMIAFMELGYDCLVPYGDASKYDFAVDIGGGKFIRIQCKTSCYSRNKGVVDKGAFKVYTMSQTVNTKGIVRKEYTSDDIDYFATYFEGKVYVIPVWDSITGKTLRVIPPKHNINYNSAEDYEISNVFPKSNKLLSSELKFYERLTIINDNEVIKNGKHFCLNCAKEVIYGRAFCVECTHLMQRKVERPNRDVLKQLIRELPFKEIGRRYGVSDNSIRKWCKYYSLPNTKNVIANISDEEWGIV